MQTYLNPAPGTWPALQARPAAAQAKEVEIRVRAIFEEVRREGDAALRRLTQQLDGALLESLVVSPRGICRGANPGAGFLAGRHSASQSQH
jgi:histidinol dehydrogenase